MLFHVRKIYLHPRSHGFLCKIFCLDSGGILDLHINSALTLLLPVFHQKKKSSSGKIRSIVLGAYIPVSPNTTETITSV